MLDKIQFIGGIRKEQTRSLFTNETESRHHEKYLDDPKWMQSEFSPCCKCSRQGKYGEPCSFAHHLCKHFDEWKYFHKTEREKNRIDLKYAEKLLDDCWGHHQDGSDLLMNSSELFNRVFNQVIPLINKIEKRI
jgi:hypothetical protein